MSQLLIQKYYNDISRLKEISGSRRESVVREAFKDLLKDWGRSAGLTFVPEHEVLSTAKDRNYVDGALLQALRVPFGYWEAKDEDDDLDREIAKKFRRGYPKTNIIFEDTREAVLFQNGKEIIRCPMEDKDRLGHLLKLFFEYEPGEIADFRKAIAQFKTDLPAVLKALRASIDEAYSTNAEFAKDARDFLKHAKETINPAVAEADIREMLIQHILTEDIFARVFGQDEFHRENNVAKSLYTLEAKFFRGDVKRQTMRVLEPYYAAIRSTAALISSHAEKQGFLKGLYEDFYKVYNPKAADRLGVVYTPNEIVRFMIESADWLCEKHFGKTLIDKNVEILDPATGTGTFIVELLEHFRGQPAKLKYKYENELHANEVAILPYYVANLNIEATYAAIMKEYREFPNLCFVDTLDNVAALARSKEITADLFAGVSDENLARVRRQNERKISVVIGNPPYNANQRNENDNNRNRSYEVIDDRIRATYIAASTAQKTKLYDMYARFFRWASDRISDEGIVSFVSNSSFIAGRTFDGFRKELMQDFSEIWIVDLKGNARTSGERRKREAGNVFDDQIRVGIAVYFCVRTQSRAGCRIFYQSAGDYLKSDEKRAFLTTERIGQRRFEPIEPDKNYNWIGNADTNFDQLLPVISRNRSAAGIFDRSANSIKSNRDDGDSRLDVPK